jgi:predicted GIY-YIG superfamily endonuclease
MSAASLYRHFDKSGALLYVGMTIGLQGRLKTHARKAPWFNEVQNITVERFETRDQAITAEREAVRKECPKYNVVRFIPRPPKKEKEPYDFAAESSRPMTPQFAVEALLARGWTQAQIAESVGVAQPTIYRIKSGVIPSWDVGTAVVNLAKTEKAKRRRVA